VIAIKIFFLARTENIIHPFYLLHIGGTEFHGRLCSRQWQVQVHGAAATRDWGDCRTL